MSRDPGIDALSHVQDIMVKLFELKREAVVPEARLVEDLDLDSIDAIDMVVEIQSRSGATIEEEALQRVRTVADVVDLLETMQQRKAAEKRRD